MSFKARDTVKLYNYMLNIIAKYVDNVRQTSLLMEQIVVKVTNCIIVRGHIQRNTNVLKAWRTAQV